MSASRTDLLAWLNDLLQINYTKVEQCGAGGAYCQILDSIYGDIPMSRVKMNAKHEYEFVANFKVMQNVFKAKKIDKHIPVEKLVQCKMQDNLEFLQWMKRFWDSNYSGTPYNAVARRNGAAMEPTASVGTKPLGFGGARAGGRTPIGVHNARSAQPREAEVQVVDTESLEKERDSFGEKLRQIEVVVEEKLALLEADGKDDDTLREIQRILYTTDDGFEVTDDDSAGEDTF